MTMAGAIIIIIIIIIINMVYNRCMYRTRSLCTKKV
jgi:hypothetical protein